ncbi:MAG: ArsR/SmtB family transcription factor [Candidatus Bathyarchaeia archaeon]|jgi:predicted transcriptional regulator
MENLQIDLMLKAIENPVRRKIIRRLSQEPSYPLELAKEIGEAQQLVTSHLSILEKAGIVGSKIVASPVGPNRRSFFLKESGYLSLSFGPHLFHEQFLNFQALPSKLSIDAIDIMRRISDIDQSNVANKIEPFSSLLKDIDDKLADIESEKTVLLFLRNLAMKHATKDLVNKDKTHDERRILHYILDEGTKDVESISNALNLKESIVKLILEKLREDIP